MPDQHHDDLLSLDARSSSRAPPGGSTTPGGAVVNDVGPADAIAPRARLLLYALRCLPPARFACRSSGRCSFASVRRQRPHRIARRPRRQRAFVLRPTGAVLALRGSGAFSTRASFSSTSGAARMLLGSASTRRVPKAHDRRSPHPDASTALAQAPAELPLLSCRGREKPRTARKAPVSIGRTSRLRLPLGPPKPPAKRSFKRRSQGQKATLTRLRQESASRRVRVRHRTNQLPAPRRRHPRQPAVVPLGARRSIAGAV